MSLGEFEIELKNEYGDTALMIAAAGNHYQSAELFLIRGAKHNTVNKQGWTALMIAARAGAKEAVEMLARLGISESGIDKSEKTINK